MELEATSSSTQQSSIPAVDSIANPMVQDHPPLIATTTGPTDNGEETENTKKKKKKKKKKIILITKNNNNKKRVSKDYDNHSSSSCSSSSSSSTRVVLRRRNPRPLFGAAPPRNVGNVDAIALPLGMSVAAVIALVLETKDTAGGRMSIDHLSTICTSAVRESLVNVFGVNFDCFMRNFEKSFGSTLRTLRLINESHVKSGGHHFNNLNEEGPTPAVTLDKGGCTNNSSVEDFQSDTALQNFATQDLLNTVEEGRENMLTGSITQELVLHGQTNQVACVFPHISDSAIEQSMHGSIQKSLIEQARSNDLKALELGLTMKRLKLKETQLALNYDSNHLERSKLAMGISKASFKAEKFKSQLEETRHSELLRKCIDCLVAGLFIMSASLLYGTYVFSYKRITEATESCTPSPKESKSWWIPSPMASFNSGMHVLRCQVQVVSRMLFGVFMIIAIAFLFLQRSSTTKQIMPVTVMVLLLGIACGFAGKLCVDTLGGSGYYWLLYWEILCVLHFFSNVCTSTLFRFLHGSVNLSQGTKGNAIFPYWIRRFLFYAFLLFFLPLFCGLVPFASLGDWKDHFLLLVRDYLITGNEL
nr:protein CPR-5 [Quercus suber]